MDPIKSVYLTLARIKDGVVDLACGVGLIQSPQTLIVDGTSAKFKVTSASERWRVQDAMGERIILERFVDEVTEGDCVWDIGAAVGTYSCLATALDAEIVAFEPHPTNRRRCLENLHLNDADGTVIETALSETTGTMSLAEDAGVGSGMHQLSNTGEIEVSVKPGDEIDVQSPDIIKIDVEGHEVAVLNGLTETLQTTRVVFVECHPNMDISAESVREILEGSDFTVDQIPTNRFDEVFLIGRKYSADMES